MKLFYTDHFELPLPEGHRFPMQKYRLLRNRIAADDAHRDDALIVPQAVTYEQLILAHDQEYVDRVCQGRLTKEEIRRIGFPWSPLMVERSKRSSGATLAAARAALREGLAVNMAGGTHHAMRAAGEGYCVFNDAAVTLLTLLAEGQISRAAVLDCDVHQGNGTAEILASESRVVTFSMHGAKNFPLRKHPSDIDIELADATNDAEFLYQLKMGLDAVLKMGPYDLVIYLAGADPFSGDRLGRLAVSKAGLKARDEMVLETCCLQNRIPLAMAMAGGYANVVEDIVDIHAASIAVASRICRQWMGRSRSYGT